MVAPRRKNPEPCANSAEALGIDLGPEKALLRKAADLFDALEQRACEFDRELYTPRWITIFQSLLDDTFTELLEKGLEARR